MDRRLLPHLFIVYCVISGIVGISLLSFVITVILLVLLEIYKLPPASRESVERVLQVGKCSIIAHRGGANDAPENTLAAIRKAKSNGADGIEFDLEFSKDGVPLLMHDDTIDRTTDGKGNVRSYTFAELQNFNAAAKHRLSKEFPHEKIPSLEQTVTLCLELGLKMYIDVKGGSEQAVSAITALFKKHPEMYDNAAVCSFWPQVPYLVKKADHNIVTGLTHRHKVLTRKVDGTERNGPLYKRLFYPIVDIMLEWSIYNWLWYLCGTSAFLVCVGDVSVQVVEKFAERGIHLVVWTANDNLDKQFIHSRLRSTYMTDTLLEQGCAPQKN